MPSIQEFAASNPWGFSLIVMGILLLICAILTDGPRERRRGRRW